MFKIVKVSGRSLEPLYQNGDFVLISKIPVFLKRLKRGDVVVIEHPRYGTLIKQVERLEAGAEQVFVLGIHDGSIDSRLFGAVPRKLITGKVIWHISRRLPGQHL